MPNRSINTSGGFELQESVLLFALSLCTPPKARVEGSTQ